MKSPPTAREPEWTILKLLRWTTSYFQSHDIDSPRATAEILLAYALKLNRIDLYLQYDQPMFSAELAAFKSLIKRRANREPVAYIVGTKEFWSMDLSVTDKVLIPRPETEILVEKALALTGESNPSGLPPDPLRILEIGTGSGAIILALAAERPDHLFFASDLSLSAIRQAKRNAKHHQIEDGVLFFNCDLFEGLKRRSSPFHMILSNPPYIPTGDLDRLQPEIHRFEPRIALDGHQDGLFFIRQIIHQAHQHLEPGGHLLLEIGHDQKPMVENIIDDSDHYEDVVFTKDYSGYDRVVSMRKRT